MRPPGRPPARGGPTLYESPLPLVERSSIVGPPLAGGLRWASRTGLACGGLRAPGWPPARATLKVAPTAGYVPLYFRYVPVPVVGTGVTVGSVVGVGDGVGEGVGDGVGDGVGEGVGDGVGDGLGFAVGVTVGVPAIELTTVSVTWVVG